MLRDGGTARLTNHPGGAFCWDARADPGGAILAWWLICSSHSCRAPRQFVGSRHGRLGKLRCRPQAI